jgi:hypothetical protein
MQVTAGTRAALGSGHQPPPKRSDGLVQRLFRSVNTHVRELERTWPIEVYDLVCECSDLRCTQAVRVCPEEYDALLDDTAHFVVIPGHERPVLDRVVSRNDRYAVVAVAA